ncbi:hypothetical protein [Actinokineospora pegani]|uniref:hypothetical protein n=1 Tax=Actinokineospora pegani TaxID=2654637 RepID=UPI0012E9A652|nr:hypothetical protein [Actinokineospora pegani]
MKNYAFNATPDNHHLPPSHWGLSPDAIILIPSTTTTPMRTPDNTWAFLVLAVDLHATPDQDVALFAGTWLPEKPPAAAHDGDTVITLTESKRPTQLHDGVDIEVLVAHDGQWQLAGTWQNLTNTWPLAVAKTVATTIRLHQYGHAPMEAAETSPTHI